MYVAPVLMDWCDRGHSQETELHVTVKVKLEKAIVATERMVVSEHGSCRIQGEETNQPW